MKLQFWPPRGPAPHTAEDATPRELTFAILRLGAMFVILALLVVPLLRDLPLGQTTRTGMLAWLLLGLALYWLYAGLGYQALLLPQLVVFSASAVLLTTKAMLVIVGIDRLSILRRTAKSLIIVGAALAVVNLVLMGFALLVKFKASSGERSRA